MNKQSLTIIKTILLGLDIVTLNLCFTLSWAFFDERIPYRYNSDYLEFFIVLNIIWIALSSLTNIYRKDTLLSFEYFSRKSAFTYLLWFASLTTYLFFFHEITLSRIF